MPRFLKRQRALRAVRHRVESSILLESSSNDSDGCAVDFEMPGFDAFDQNEFTADSNEGSLGLDSSSNSQHHYSDDEHDRPDCLIELYFVMYNTRYFIPRRVNNKSTEFRQMFFHDLHDDLFWQLTRMNKSSFFHLLEKVEAHPIFHNKAIVQQAPIESQLAVCLDRLGHDGNGACLNHMIPTWGISFGSLVNFSKRCFRALEEVLKNMIQFPSRNERSVISAEFAKRGFPGCVGLIDGSLMPLAQRPAVLGECYWTRKSPYSINVQIVCDHHRKIQHVFAGMPRSCSNLTCTKKSPIWSFLTNCRSSILFDADQYILGDSGYQCMPHLVSAFKRADTNNEKENFNTCVAKCRVMNEHCIGVLKSRWHSLKEIRIQLNARKDSVWMVRWITLCAKLHNYVISENDDWTAADLAADVGHQTDGELDVEPSEAADGVDAGRVSHRALVAAGS